MFPYETFWGVYSTAMIVIIIINLDERLDIF